MPRKPAIRRKRRDDAKPVRRKRRYDELTTALLMIAMVLSTMLRLAFKHYS